MSIKLTDKQYELLSDAIKNRISELTDLLNPILRELKEHENFLTEYNKKKLTSSKLISSSQSFELLTWSKKIIKVLEDNNKSMSANEIVAEIVNRIPGLAEESSTRSSVASLLSRRTGKLFRKLNGRFGLIDWHTNQFQ
ncbi:hypothetical protein [Daejeonella oryzae]|uniref:hypothetical protein n=1 Tax=Daejeonella oryzae TaxID=1122943 RepID=UPI00047A5EA6|nr:hypothetical protein [Daejeonella oryzae]